MGTVSEREVRGDDLDERGASDVAQEGKKEKEAHHQTQGY